MAEKANTARVPLSPFSCLEQTWLINPRILSHETQQQLQSLSQ